MEGIDKKHNIFPVVIDHWVRANKLNKNSNVESKVLVHIISLISMHIPPLIQLIIKYTNYIFLSILISPTAVIKELNSIILDQLHIPIKNQILKYCDKILAQQTTINEYDIYDKCIINLCVKMEYCPPKRTLESLICEQKQKNLILIYGYTPKTIYLPFDIMNLLFLFCYFVEFHKFSYKMGDEWDKWGMTQRSSYGQQTSSTLVYNPWNESIEENNILSRGNDLHGMITFGHQTLNKGVIIWRFKTLTTRCCSKIGIINTLWMNDNKSHYWNLSENKCNYMVQVSGDYDDFEYDLWNQRKIGSEMCIMLDFKKQSLFYSFNNKPFKKLFDKIDTTKEYKLAVIIPWSDWRRTKLQMIASAYYFS